MKNFDAFKSMEDFKQLVSQNELFSFRVGVFNKDQFGFHAAANFFLSFFPDKAPITKMETIRTPVGLIARDSVLLEPDNFYEEPGKFIRQADILLPLSQDLFLGNPDYWVIGSQTCTVENDLSSVILPCYHIQSFCEALPLLKSTKAPAVGYYINTIKPNKNSRFLAFPPNDNLGESNLVIDLGQIQTVSSDKIKSQAKVIQSMSFAGLSYFQNRLAMVLFRDVKGWTDERQLR
jgi:hypothetical protein